MIKKIRSLICVIFALMLVVGTAIPASAVVSAGDDELALEIESITEDSFFGSHVNIEYENNIGEEMSLYSDSEIIATTTDGKEYYGNWWNGVIGKGCGTLTSYFDSDCPVDSIDTITITTIYRDEIGFSSANDIVLYEDGEIVENVVVDFSLDTDIAAAVGVSGIAVILSGIFTIIGGLITLLGPLLVILIFAGSSLLFILIVVIIIIAVVKHNKKNKQSNTTYTPVTGESNGDDGGFAPPPEM